MQRTHHENFPARQWSTCAHSRQHRRSTVGRICRDVIKVAVMIFGMSTAKSAEQKLLRCSLLRLPSVAPE